jgi:hypothetical protein
VSAALPTFGRAASTVPFWPDLVKANDRFKYAQSDRHLFVGEFFLPSGRIRPIRDTHGSESAATMHSLESASRLQRGRDRPTGAQIEGDAIGVAAACSGRSVRASSPSASAEAR